MRKLFGIAALCFTLLFCCGCDVNEMSTLSDLSKPYTGVYECRTLMLGGQDYKEKFDKLYLDLKYDGTYSLVWQGVNGEKGERTGKYKTDGEAEEITFYGYFNRRASSYTFSMKKGVIAIRYNMGGQLLNAEFALP